MKPFSTSDVFSSVGSTSKSFVRASKDAFLKAVHDLVKGLLLAVFEAAHQFLVGLMQLFSRMRRARYNLG